MTTRLVLLLLCVGLCLVASLVDAGCMSGFKRMFGKESSYAMLAEHLHTATPSSELEANTAAARIYRDQIDEDHKKGINLKSLVGIFSELDGGDDPERLCGMANLANLRLVAEAMREGGNLSPRSLSEPIRRLNRIIIKLIVKARRVCLIHRDSKWLMQAPRVWRPPFNSAKNMFLQLDEVPEIFSRESYLFGDGPSSYAYDKTRLGHLLSTVLELNALREAKESDPLSKPELATDTKIISKQLEDYVTTPCAELESLRQSQSILVPYYELIATIQIIDKSQTNFMKKFYESSSEEPALEPVGNNEDVQRIAYQLRTCAILKQMNKRLLVKLVAKDRSNSDGLPDLDDDDNEFGTGFNTAGIGGIVG